MTIQEAIDHCYEVSGHCTNKQCSIDHRQLAAWLEELEWYRKKFGSKRKYMDVSDDI